jgi:hypothetical protein
VEQAVTYQVKIVIQNNHFNLSNVSKEELDGINSCVAKYQQWWNPFKKRTLIVDAFRERLLLKVSKIEAVYANVVKP